MNRRSWIALGMTLALVVAGTAFAGPGKTVTLEGKVLCAKCSLHEQDSCQNVLVVEKKKKPKYYYLTSNEANEKFGEICAGSKMVRVTGTVDKHDGHRWLAATKIVPVKDAS